jgi:hypothetical protein
VNIPGYLAGLAGLAEEPVLVDATPLLKRLDVRLALLSSALWESGLPDQGIDVEAADAELWQLDRWPCFTVPLPSGARLAVVHRNLPDEGGIDLLVDPQDRTPAFPLAWVDGHASLPGLSWPELVGVASGAADPARTMLLLFPFVGDDLPDAVTAVIEATLAACGVPRSRQQVARLLIDLMQGPGWGQRDGAPMHLGRGSTRGGAAKPEFRAKVANLLPGASSSTHLS